MLKKQKNVESSSPNRSEEGDAYIYTCIKRIFSDGNDDYTYVLPDYYADSCINYGQLVKSREKGKVLGKEKRAIYSNPDPGDIGTTDIENFNGIL